MCVEREMPKYQSHKIVHALKIKDIVFDCELASTENRETDGSAMITPEEKLFASFKVDREFVRRLPQNHPNEIVGGYYVVYEDGYESWSPAKAFEDGYTKL